MREVTPTRSAFLELQDERQGMEEGYRFLDEKRLVLAARILRELAQYEQRMESFRETFSRASDALQAAVGRHGLEGLQVYPAATLEEAEVEISQHSVLGVVLQEAALRAVDSLPPRPTHPTPEADGCRALFAELLVQAANLAAISGNLQRLRDEYRRTERRARALEDVLLPEIDQTLAQLEVRLEELDREEVLRVRYVK